MTDKEKQQIEEIRVEIWRENTTLSDVCYYIIRKQQEVRKETAKEIEDLVLHFSTATFDKDGKPIIKLDTDFYKALREKYKIPLDNEE